MPQMISLGVIFIESNVLFEGIGSSDVRLSKFVELGILHIGEVTIAPEAIIEPLTIEGHTNLVLILLIHYGLLKSANGANALNGPSSFADLSAPMTCSALATLADTPAWS